ncbi:MAG: sugar ABC transporter substrate-binding protein [Tropheryma whipplei]|nr:sugar ABC transporter substrate-binding protein [Tropheryma whipplei]
MKGFGMSISKGLFRAVLFTAAASLFLMSCLGGGRDESKTGGVSYTKGFPSDSLIGVAITKKTSQNQVDAGNFFEELLKDAGFKSKVVFANNGVSEQQSQIDNMIASGAKVIVVNAVDSSLLGPQLKRARQAGVIVFDYDRLLENTKDVDFYVTYNARTVGILQANALLQGLEKKKPGGPWNIELFAGSPDDSNSRIFFDSAMSVLNEKIKSGKLIVVSGQTDFAKAVTQDWSAENAQKRMDVLLSTYYNTKQLDGVLGPNDVLARAILRSVELAGKPVPVVVGQDAEEPSLKLIAAGKQYSTVAKSTRALVEATVKAIRQLADKKLPETNSKSNNGEVEIPTILLTPKIITKENLDTIYKK